VPGLNTRFTPARFLLAVLTATAAMAWSSVSVATQTVAEPALKAAFLINFARFTEWPADLRPAAAPLRFCTADADVVAALEAAVAGKTIAQRALVVSRVGDDVTAQAAASPGCAVFYAGRVDSRRASALATALRPASVLTVGDAPDFAASGGVIEFYVEARQLRFAINRAAADGARLKLGAPLLSLAKIVGFVKPS
jgi:hypothetical protein